MALEFRFGRFTLDGTRRELRHDGKRIQLEPNGYRILAYLVQHRHRAVARRELMEAVWPEVHVSIASLYTAFYQLRSTLRAADPSCSPIQTLRGYGFLFSEPVEVDAGTPSSGRDGALERDRQLLSAYGSLATEGLWCFELERPLSVTLPEPALIDAVLGEARLSYANPSLARTYGYADPSELIGRPLTDFLVADRPENLAYLRDVIRRRTVRDAVSVEVDRSGAPRWFSNDVTCVVQGREFLRVCGMQRDVTGSRSARVAPHAEEPHGRDLVGALLELERLSQQALASVARGEPSDDAWMSLSEAHERADQLRKMLA